MPYGATYFSNILFMKLMLRDDLADIQDTEGGLI